MANSEWADRLRRAVEAAIDKTIDHLEPGAARRAVRAELVAEALAEYAVAMRDFATARVAQLIPARSRVERIEESLGFPLGGL